MLCTNILVHIDADVVINMYIIIQTTIIKCQCIRVHKNSFVHHYMFHVFHLCFN